MGVKFLKWKGELGNQPLKHWHVCCYSRPGSCFFPNPKDTNMQKFEPRLILAGFLAASMGAIAQTPPPPADKPAEPAPPPPPVFSIGAVLLTGAIAAPFTQLSGNGKYPISAHDRVLHI